MRRRELIKLLSGVAAAWPLMARAQQAVPLIGFLNVGARVDSELALPGFRQGLREAGFIEGQNVAIEYRWAENRPDRVPALAAELVQRRVAVIVACPNFNAIAPAKAATSTIPIVFLSGPDPVRQGLVASLNRPGGNATGVTLLSADVTPKRLGLLHDVAPQARTIATLLSGKPGRQSAQIFNLNDAVAAGSNVGIRVVGVWADGENEFDAAFASAVGDGAGALLVSTSIFLINNRYRLVTLASKHNLPAIYQDRAFPSAGGLMSYGPRMSDSYRQVGIYTGRVLKGEKPADLPVVLPTKFEFIINLQTARAMGITMPDGILAIADEVIE